MTICTFHLSTLCSWGLGPFHHTWHMSVILVKLPSGVHISDIWSISEEQGCTVWPFLDNSWSSLPWGIWGWFRFFSPPFLMFINPCLPRAADISCGPPPPQSPTYVENQPRRKPNCLGWDRDIQPVYSSRFSSCGQFLIFSTGQIPILSTQIDLQPSSFSTKKIRGWKFAASADLKVQLVVLDMTSWVIGLGLFDHSSSTVRAKGVCCK